MSTSASTSSSTPASVAVVDPAPSRDADSGVLSRLSDRALLWIILGGFLLLGVWYTIAVPAFETPDEVYHYAFARHLAQGNWLPVQSDTSTGPWAQEGSQAPLYYLLTGWLTAGVDQSDFEDVAAFNPRANMGNPLFPGNKNRMLYSGAPAPLQGSNLALHMGRWLSLAMGAVTIWLVYRTAKLAFAGGSRLPLMAALLVAALPQFIFLSASFSNDNMVVVMSAAVMYWLARILSASHSRPPRAWEWLALGVLLGLAALSKLQALGLFVLAGGVGLAVAWRERSWRTLFVAALGCALPAALIAGWWYWRNQSLYGDWTGLSHLTAINGMRQKPLDLDDFWLEFRGLRYSFWGLFGWFNILLPSWFYAAMDALSVVAVAGAVSAVVAGWRRRKGALLRACTAQVRLLLLAWIALSAVLLLYWMMRATGSQGRLVFPALSALAVWFVIGLDFWLRRLPRPSRGAAWAVTPALLLAMSVYGVAVAIPSAYAAPKPVRSIPAQAAPAEITYVDADAITLLAVETPDQRYRPGESVPVTLYLTAGDALERDYELFVQLLDTDGEVLGNVTTHPGWGRNPTSLWRPGAIYADAYEVPVTGFVDARSPRVARLYVGFIHPDAQAGEQRPLTALDAAGNEVTPFVGDVVIAPHSPPALADFDLQPAQIRFGETFELSGIHTPASVSPGQTITATLMWTALAPPGADYTAFVHLLDAEGGFVGGHDQAPATGFPTSAWQAGDRVVSDMTLEAPADLPAGEYGLWVGLYDSESEGRERLPITDAAEAAAAHDLVRVGSLTAANE